MVQIVTDGLLERIKKLDDVNKDLMPKTYGSRTIGPVGLGLTWVGLCVNLSAFLVFGSHIEWLTVGEAMLAGLIGFTMLALIQTVTQEIGIIYGITYPTASRTHFGYAGSKLISFIKIPSTAFWGGMNTFLGGGALNEVFKATFGFDNIFIAMGIFAVISIYLVFDGAAILAKFNTIVAPVLGVMFVYIGYLLFKDSGVSVFQIFSMGGAETHVPISQKMGQFALCTMAAMGMWFGLSLAMPNITAECKTDPSVFNSWLETNKHFAIAEWLGLAPVMLALAFLGASSAILTGEVNPINVITATIGAQSKTILIMTQLFICLAIWSTNGGANILPSALLLCNVFKKVPLRVMTIIFLAGALAIRPWNLTGMITQIVSFLGGIQAPLGGMIMIDFMLIRKRRISLEDLYNTQGKYRYWKGHNPAAWITYGVTMFFMLLGPLRNYSIVVGVIISSILYYFLMTRWVFKKYPESKENVAARFPNSLEEAEAIDEKINAELGMQD